MTLLMHLTSHGLDTLHAAGLARPLRDAASALLAQASVAGTPTGSDPAATPSTSALPTVLQLSTWRELSINSPHTLAVALGVFAGVLLLSYLVRHVVIKRIRSFADKTSTQLDNLALALVMDLRVWAIVIVAFAIASSVLHLPAGLARAVQVVTVLAVAVQVLISSRLVVDFATRSVMERSATKEGKPDPSVKTATGVVRTLVTGIIGFGVLLLAMENLGIRVTPLLGALGLGGIAIALATQNILSDLFASLIIVFDKPFQVGDAITVGDKSGVVERIGIKTTRIRAATGEEIIFCNTDLLTSRLHNMQRLQERRVAMVLGVTYETPEATLRNIPGIVQRCVEHAQAKGEQVRFDRCHLRGFGAYALDFEAVYFVTTSDFMSHVRAQHFINMAILEAFSQAGVAFAYPTSVQMQKSA